MFRSSNNRWPIITILLVGFIAPLLANAVNIGGYIVGGETPVPTDILPNEQLQQLYDYNVSRRDSPRSSILQKKLAALDIHDIKIEQAMRAGAPAEEIARLRNARPTYARFVDEASRPAYGSTVAYFADDNTALEKFDINSKAHANECGISSWSRINQCAINFITWILNLIAWLLALLMWVVSKIFQNVLDLTVINFGAPAPDGLGNSRVIAGIWGTLRNLVNLSFIFILLYVAIGTILQLHHEDNKTLIKNVILIALLVNFSLFFTRVIIDVSNVLAVQFYNQIDTTGDLNIASEFQRRLGVEAPFFGTPGVEPVFEDSAKNKEWKKAITHYLGAIFLLGAGCLVLIAGTILLLIRGVVLILLMIFSPLAFGAYAVPGLKHHFDDWLHKLFDQAFFAPFFLFMIYLTFQLLSPETRLLITGGNEQSWTHLLIYQVLLISFMMGAIVVAKKMGAVGASFASNTAGKMTFGLASWAARNTLGRISERRRDSEGLLNEAIYGKTKFSRWMARRKVGFYNRAAKTSFDLRNASPIAGLAKATHLELGAAHHGSFYESEEHRVKKYEEIAKRYKVTNHARMHAAHHADETKEHAEELTEHSDEADEKVENEYTTNNSEAINTQMEALEKARGELAELKVGTPEATAKVAEIDKIKDTIKDLNNAVSETEKAALEKLKEDIAAMDPGAAREAKQKEAEKIKQNIENLQKMGDNTDKLIQERENLKQKERELKKATTEGEREAKRVEIEEVKNKIQKINAERKGLAENLKNKEGERLEKALKAEKAKKDPNTKAIAELEAKKKEQARQLLDRMIAGKERLAATAAAAGNVDEEEKLKAEVATLKETRTQNIATVEAWEEAAEKADAYSKIKRLSRQRRKDYFQKVLTAKPRTLTSAFNFIITGGETQGSRNTAAAEGWREQDKSPEKKFADALEKTIKKAKGDTENMEVETDHSLEGGDALED